MKPLTTSSKGKQAASNQLTLPSGSSIPTTSRASTDTAVKNLTTLATTLLAGSEGSVPAGGFKSGKHVCFTMHVKGDNPTGEQVREAIKVVWSLLVPKCSRAVIGLEQGLQGRWHGQGYASFVKAQKLSQLRSLADIGSELVTGIPRHPGFTMHFIRARGTPKQNLEYCTKTDKNAWIHTKPGEPNGEFEDKNDQGKRNDLKGVLDFCNEHGLEPDSEWKLMNEHPEVFFRHPKATQRALFLARKRARRRIGYQKPEVYLFYGDEGTGKSRKAQHMAESITGDPVAVYRQPPGKWWPGLDGERVIILDDFRDEWCTPSTLLQWLDGYPFQVEDKGSHAVPYFTHIFITSNEPVGEWWKEAREKKPNSKTWAAIERRLEHREHFTKAMFPTPWKPNETMDTEGSTSGTQEDSERVEDPSELTVVPWDKTGRMSPKTWSEMEKPTVWHRCDDRCNRENCKIKAAILEERETREYWKMN